MLPLIDGHGWLITSQRPARTCGLAGALHPLDLGIPRDAGQCMNDRICMIDLCYND